MKRTLTATVLAALCALHSWCRAADPDPPTGSRVYDIGIYVTDLDRTTAFYKNVFGFKETRRWKSMRVRVGDGDGDGDGDEQEAPLPGVFLEGANGTNLEFLQRGKPENRQVAQEPINHVAIHVDDVKATLDRALTAGTKLAFPDAAIQFARIGDYFAVEHTQIIGLDGERIQILHELSPWSDLAAIPAPVQEIYPAVVGDKIVVGGGFGKAEEGAKKPRIEDRCFIYNATARTWNEGPELPVKRHHLYL